MEKQLKLLNKPAVKTIKTIYGDIYNCVDFYKQPAFDHPLLKNHSFHPQACLLNMKPTLFRTEKKSENSSTTPSSRMWLKGKGCPLGTVPIKRITKEDLIRQRSMPPPENVIFDDRWATSNNNSEQKGIYSSSQGYKVAIARTPINPNNKFAGGGMSASIWNPHVEGQQHSACRLKIQKEQDIIQVGWRVDPILYGNTQTRLFIHFQAGKKHCFNILCPGFVIVSPEIPVDMLYDQVSHRGDNTSLEDEMGISRDLVNGNWWLLMEDNHIKVGFWPQQIFTSLTSFATDVEWGGVVYSPPGVPEPPMGSSFFPVNDTTYDAYCSGLQVLNAKGEMIDVDRVITHVDDTNLYKILDYPHASPGKFQHYILYGGPGENT
ncbi:hypothetical protein KY289_028956 [Solanum tuberosum]|nr:hypothetical protein KY289_028956 [Solanum tuberosum]